MKHIYLLLLFGLLSLTTMSDVLAQSGYGIQDSDARTSKISQVKLFPNPATERFTINMDGLSLKYITINNIIGKEVRRVVTTPDHTFEVGDLKRGIYIIRIFDEKDELVKALRLSKT